MIDDVTWDLSDLYEAPEDPGLAGDREWCLREVDRLASTYAGRVAALSAEELFGALKLQEKVEEVSERIGSFAYLFFVTRCDDPDSGRFWQSAQEFQTRVRQKLLFFELEWSGIAAGEARARMNHEALRPFRHYLETLRQQAPYRLSAPEERVLETLSLTGQKAWITLFDKLLGSVRFGGEGRPLAGVLADLHDPVRQKRREAALEITQGLQPLLPLLAHICSSLTLDKSLRDGLRSYPHWLSPMNLRNELLDEQIQALVGAVTSRYAIVRDYYRLKKKLLGYSELHDYDRYAPLPGRPQGRLSWEEARDLVLGAFREFSPDFAGTADLFFEQRWIHGAVSPGKVGGAFSHPTVPSCHPYISLHFSGTPRDVLTLAHELGHGIHQHLYRQQGLFHGRVPPVMAEIASVFAEMLVFEVLLARAGTPAERLAMLCAKLEEIFTTTFRQIALHRFEAGLHQERRTSGELTPDRISSLWMETQQEMHGDSLHLGDHYRTWWAYIPHFIHAPGYVHAYAFAELTALSLFRQYRRGDSGLVPLYLGLLKRGASASPEELLRPFGLDISESDFFHRGISIVEELLQEAWTCTGDTSSPPG
ncbi:MAG: M3 family oligoendopeptidase [Thermodesulfobacteriota bacterium]